MIKHEKLLKNTEDEFDFFKTNLKKSIIEVKSNQPNITNKDILLKLLLIIMFPPIAFFAVVSGLNMSNTIWDRATEKNKVTEKTEQVSYFTYIAKMNQELTEKSQ